MDQQSAYETQREALILDLTQKLDSALQEIERLKKNDYTEYSCAICLTGIRERESRCEEAGVWYHPPCKVAKERDDAVLQKDDLVTVLRGLVNQIVEDSRSTGPFKITSSKGLKHAMTFAWRALEIADRGAEAKTAPLGEKRYEQP
jgi:hypothetical protein